MDRYQEELRRAAQAQLKPLLPPGSRVYTILRHVSRSGTVRRISPVIPDTTGYILDLGYLVAPLLGGRYDGGVVIRGGGMDMGFELVYRLGEALYPDGFPCTGDGCPSNDHSNGDRDYSPHHHRDGGYALRQEWL